MKPILKIKVREKHTGEMVRAIINSKKPMVLVLEASKPRFNNKTLNISHKLSLEGWSMEYMKSLERNTKQGNHMSLLQITCKNKTKTRQSNTYHITSCSSGSGEVHRESKNSRCGANDSLREDK